MVLPLGWPGGLFVMEDQRNFGDASYKAFTEAHNKVGPGRWRHRRTTLCISLVVLYRKYAGGVRMTLAPGGRATRRRPRTTSCRTWAPTVRTSTRRAYPRAARVAVGGDVIITCPSLCNILCSFENQCGHIQGGAHMTLPSLARRVHPPQRKRPGGPRQRNFPDPHGHAPRPQPPPHPARPAAAAGGAGVRRGAAAACRAGALPAGTRGVWLGLGRIIALYHRCSTSYQIH